MCKKISCDEEAPLEQHTLAGLTGPEKGQKMDRKDQKRQTVREKNTPKKSPIGNKVTRTCLIYTPGLQFKG